MRVGEVVQLVAVGIPDLDLGIFTWYQSVDCETAKANPTLSRRLNVELLGSIGCALAPKLCGGTRTHDISKTQKSFGEIPCET